MIDHLRSNNNWGLNYTKTACERAQKHGRHSNYLISFEKNKHIMQTS